MPQAWLTLDISPQAKTLLMAFCAYADEHGQSYHSFEQLGKVLNRSRTSVCGYVKELRAAGLISCTNQEFGNGYNYRLLVRIVGWADIVASWARAAQQKISTAGRARRARADKPSQNCTAATPAVPVAPSAPASVFPSSRQAAAPAGDPALQHEPARSTESRASIAYSERSVRNSERKDPSGPINHLHQNHTSRARARVEWTCEDELEWLQFRSHDSDPVGQGSGNPAPELLRKAIAKSEDLESELGYFPTGAAATQAATQALRTFICRHRIEACEEQVCRTVDQLKQRAPSAPALEAAIAALDAAWQPHWRRLPQSRQLEETIAPVIEGALPPEPLRRKRSSFQIRAMAARLWLRKMSL